MLIPNLIIAVCWLTFLVYWFVSSRGAKRNVSKNHTTATVRIGFVVLAIAVGIMGSHFRSLYRVTPLWGWIGAIITVFGVAIAIYARRYLGNNWGMPMSVKEHPELVSTGPYAYVRHPIYSAMILTLAGTFLAAGFSWLLILVIYLAYFIYSAKREEELLEKTFPDTYPAYKARTKMLIPFIF